MANRSNFAEPSSGIGNRTKNFKMVAGSNRLRIGPAFASLAASGRWNLSINQHYGYRSAEDDKGKAYPRTFICPKVVNRKTEMVEKPCAECDDTDALKEKLELRTSKLIGEGKSEDEINTILGPQKKYLKEHNLDKKHIILAKNEGGEWGVAWLPWKALAALLERRKKVLAEDGVDILSTKDGCWVDINRAGEGFLDTVYTCDVVYEVVALENGKKAKQMKQEALTDADFDAIEATCPDLTSVGTPLTNEQIERLVESRGDAEVVDAVFNEAREVKKGKKEASPSPAPAKAPPKAPAKAPVVEEDPLADVPDEQVKVPPKAAPPVTNVIEEEQDKASDEVAELMAKLEAAKAKKAAAVKKIAAKPEPSKEPEISPDTDPDSLPDDQFIQVFGGKKK